MINHWPIVDTLFLIKALDGFVKEHKGQGGEGRRFDPNFS